jgi:hypothetical protein
VDLKDHYVQFRLGDIFMPDAATLIYNLHRSDVLLGRVIAMSDAGDREDAFVVVEVEGIKQRIVVPVERVLVRE